MLNVLSFEWLFDSYKYQDSYFGKGAILNDDVENDVDDDDDDDNDEN